MQRKHSSFMGRVCSWPVCPSLPSSESERSHQSRASTFGEVLQLCSTSIAHALSRVIKVLCRVRWSWGISKLICKSLRTAPKREQASATYPVAITIILSFPSQLHAAPRDRWDPTRLRNPCFRDCKRNQNWCLLRTYYVFSLAVRAVCCGWSHFPHFIDKKTEA